MAGSYQLDLTEDQFVVLMLAMAVGLATAIGQYGKATSFLAALRLVLDNISDAEMEALVTIVGEGVKQFQSSVQGQTSIDLDELLEEAGCL